MKYFKMRVSTAVLMLAAAVLACGCNGGGKGGGKDGGSSSAYSITGTISSSQTKSSSMSVSSLDVSDDPLVNVDRICGLR